MRQVLFVVVAISACGNEPRIAAVRDAPPPPVLDAAAADAALAPPTFGSLPTVDAALTPPPSSEKTIVYAQSGSDLFQVDPETMAMTRVGPFFEMLGTGIKYLNDVTDIAVDRQGRIVGVTFNRLLDIASTGACTAIASLPSGSRFNGLSWIRSEQGQEILLASGLDGAIYRIDPTTGSAARLGALGPGLMSSGDLVSVAGYGTLITVTGPGSDRLARLDPATGAATVIGPIGFVQVWGLGFWKSRVFGFTDAGEFILIDPKTGAGTLVSKTSAYPFWGAGVTTSVPTVIE